MMLGMYAAFYFFTALGVQATFGNTFGLFCSSLSARWPSARGLRLLRALTLISRVSGMRTSSLEGRGSLCPAHSYAGDRAYPAERAGLLVFGWNCSIRTPLSSSAWELGPLFYDVSVFINKARGIVRRCFACDDAAADAIITRSRLGNCCAPPLISTAATDMGIDVDRAHRVAFALGTGITAIAGGLADATIHFIPSSVSNT